MKRREQDTEVGQDSFLDTTANLVGVLIILVVVVGTKTRIDAFEHGKQQALEERSEGDSELQGSREESLALAGAMQRQKEQLIRHVQEKQYREQERNILLQQVTYAKQVLNEELQSVDEAKRKLVGQAQEVSKLEKAVQEIEMELEIADETERPEVILEHLPTPMAKTVFTRELHVRISGGKISVVPWDRLVDTLKTQVPLAYQRKGKRDIADSLGPLAGYLMHYRLRAVPAGLELERFELEPTSSVVEEPLEDALGPTGRLRLELASRNPRETVITAWVYPDSFEVFRKLKQTLFQDGFLTAARPLPENIRIGASPQGSRSSAQ